jgi:hypothetical protein
MHAVLVRVTIHDRDAATSELHERVVPTVSGAPGFVGGYWFALPGGNQGRGVIVFDSEAAAQAAAGMVSGAREAVTVDTVEVAEVVAHA